MFVVASLSLLLLWVLFQIGRILILLLYRDPDLIAICRRKRESRDRLIRPFLAEDRAEDEEITCLGMAELTRAVREGRFTAEAVFKAYCHAAARAHARTNCLTEILFSQGLEAAKAVKQGELCGVPISIKDHIGLKGVDSTLGAAKLAYQPAPEDALIVQALKEAGAIPLAKTNVPQTLMSFEGGNPVWGLTENPRKHGHTPGGSSSGEAALIASGGSVGGIGSDIAGSLRLPAAFCGIVALKPTPGTISSVGCRSLRPAPPPGLPPTNGPMGRSVADVALLHRIIRAPLAPDTIRETTPILLKEQLTFWVWYEDGYSPLSPACKRALRETVEVLRLAGHQVIEQDGPPFDALELVRILHALLSADGGKSYHDALWGEGVERSLWPFVIGFSLPGPFRWLLRWLLPWLAGSDPRPLAVWLANYPKDCAEGLEWEARRVAQVQKVHAGIWAQPAPPDLILCAPFALPAPRHHSMADLHWAASYSFVWNLLQYPAGVVPVGRVDASRDAVQDMPMNSFDRKIMRHYDEEEMTGLPLAVQVVGPPHADSMVLQGMQLIEDLMKSKLEPA